MLVPTQEDSARKRRHSTGEATRIALMETAEALFAVRGVEGVTLREIQLGAGQSNSSVIAYHFGSKTGLVQALITYRNAAIDERRSAALDALRADRPPDDVRSLVWLVVRPLVDSIRAGEMFVPFLARLSENPRVHTEYWPEGVGDSSLQVMELIRSDALGALQPRLRRGRVVQLYNSILNLLGEQARSNHAISEVQVHNYVDAWVGMLTAPVSDETAALMP